MSNKKDLAINYLDCCLSSKFEELEAILKDELIFSGPMLTSSTKSEYLDSLKSNPFQNETYKLVYAVEENGIVSLVYELNSDTKSILVSQSFEFDSDKISKITTIFDLSSFE